MSPKLESKHPVVTLDFKSSKFGPVRFLPRISRLRSCDLIDQLFHIKEKKSKKMLSEEF